MSLGEYFKQVKYNVQIMYSNKYILSILFFVLIPFAINFDGEKMALTIFELYIALVGVIIFTDAIKVEETLKTHEMFYLLKQNKTMTLIMRTVVNVLFIGVFSLLTLLIINYQLPGSQSLNYINIVNIFFPTTIALGVFSMTIANIFSNVALGYLFGFFYWVYWLVNMERQSIFNLFAYSARLDSYGKSKLLLLLITLALIMINNYFVNRSPFASKVGNKISYWLKK